MLAFNRLLALTILISNVSYAANNSCTRQFYKQTAPTVTSQPATQLVCFNEYVTLYSNVTHTGVYSAEYLTKQRVEIAHDLDRKDSFHLEKEVSSSPKLSDYQDSDYDRGHLAPNDDMSTIISQYQSFSLINMVPQNSNNNRVLWKGLENATRQLARTYGEVYVVSGPIYLTTPHRKLNNRVSIPDQLFKAIYVPASNVAAVYIVRNSPGTQYEVITIKQLNSLIGVDVFPMLSDYVKSSKRTLPKPYYGKW